MTAPDKYLPGFVARFAELAEDSDYSAHPELRHTTRHDITAAAEAFFWHLLVAGARCGEVEDGLAVSNIVPALKARTAFYADQGDLVEDEFTEFWDSVDAQGFTFATRERMRNELTAKFLEKKRGDGFRVVDNDEGIWVFKFWR